MILPSGIDEMYLGIEIGGTKLQLGVGSGTGGPLVALERCNVDPTRGAEGIRQQIAGTAKSLNICFLFFASIRGLLCLRYDEP